MDDLEIICWEGTHATMISLVAVPALLVYVVIIPSIIWYIIFRKNEVDYRRTINKMTGKKDAEEYMIKNKQQEFMVEQF